MGVEYIIIYHYANMRHELEVLKVYRPLGTYARSREPHH